MGRRNPGQFQPGDDPRRTAPFQPGEDPRRHRFTPEECSRGGQLSFAWLLEHKPEVLLGLKKKLRQQRRAQGQGLSAPGATTHTTGSTHP